MIPYCILIIENDDDRAFMEALFHNYERLMYHEINKILKNEWDSEDVMQSTLVKLIDKLALLRSRTRDQLVNYIISACKNTAQNYLRDHKQGNESSYEDFLNMFQTDNDGHLMELSLIKKDELSTLFYIWPKLDERSHHLLEGCYILERPIAELGNDLGIKPGSVRMALTRARKAAFKLLEQQLEMNK